MHYYNDNDPTKAEWLRQLIRDGHIPAGFVDERSILEVDPADLVRFTQHHFFAGVGGWPFAFELAQWSPDRPVASASCPCQPFSQTGKRLGTADPRHLWPAFFELARALRFPAIFGEQVSGPDGEAWLDGVCADLEAEGYTVGAHVLCAAGVGAPHPRHRIYWVAYADPERSDSQHPCLRAKTQRWVGEETLPQAAGRGAALRLADSGGERQEMEILESGDGAASGRVGQAAIAGVRGASVGLGHANGSGSQGRHVGRYGRDERAPWASSVGVQGTDGKVRRIEPGVFPLVDGLPERVGLIGGAGNAIVPLLAAEFIQSSEESRWV